MYRKQNSSIKSMWMIELWGVTFIKTFANLHTIGINSSKCIGSTSSCGNTASAQRRSSIASYNTWMITIMMIKVLDSEITSNLTQRSSIFSTNHVCRAYSRGYIIWDVPLGDCWLREGEGHAVRHEKRADRDGKTPERERNTPRSVLTSAK